MKVSLNWAQQHSNVDFKSMPTADIVSKIGAQLGEVETVEDWGPRYDGIVVAKIISCEKHPDANKLSICRIDDGGAVQDVERGNDGHVQVVCGAPNAKTGLTVAWLPPGSTVPESINKDPFILEARDIRGQKSNGMLASAHELGLSDNHDGILEIDSADVGEELTRPGTAFKKLYGLDDVIIEIENKMFTHRPDCFGILGVARELGGIMGQKFVSPDWYTRTAETTENEAVLNLESENGITNLVPRFMLQVVENLAIGPGPIWQQAGLNRIGIRPINNLVDLSNFYMQLTAQPTHAFDYGKIKALSGGQATLMPRMARDGEELTLLSGKTIKLTKDDIVIATDKKAVALAGIMGGAESEVDENTKNIIIECATFDMYTIRRSSMRHGLFTDASTRYTKGQSPLQNNRVLAKLAEDIISATGAKAGRLIDIKAPEVRPSQAVDVSADFVNIRLGSTFSAADMSELLQNVEFEVSVDGDILSVTPPFWRTDIDIPEDIVEEVGRLHGYDNLPMNLPRRSLKPPAQNESLALKEKIRSILSGAGTNEVLSYSFVPGNLLDKVGQNKDLAFQIANALSPELQYYRLSLTPSLLENIHPNIKAGNARFALFEINPVHSKSEIDADGLPREFYRVALVMSADAKIAAQHYGGAPYYQALRLAQELFGSIRPVLLKLAGYDFSGHQLFSQLAAPFEPERSAVLLINDKPAGIVGEYRYATRKNLKLPDFTAGFELILSALNAPKLPYEPLPKFPKIEQDISLKIPASVSFSELADLVAAEVENIKPADSRAMLSPIDIYQSDSDKDHKNITFRLWVSAFNRTLVAEEINGLLDQVAAKSKEKFGAERL